MTGARRVAVEVSGLPRDALNLPMLTARSVSDAIDQCRPCTRLGVDAIKLEALYVLALSTGMRQGELLGLTWASVDIASGWVEVRASLDRRTKVGWVLTDPKTSRSRRRISTCTRTSRRRCTTRLRRLSSGCFAVSGPRRGPVGVFTWYRSRDSNSNALAGRGV